MTRVTRRAAGWLVLAGAASALPAAVNATSARDDRNGTAAAQAASDLAAALVDDRIAPAAAIERLKSLGPAAVPAMIAALETDSIFVRGRIAVALEGAGYLGAPVVDQAISALAPGKQAASHFALAEAARVEATPGFAGVDPPQPERTRRFQHAAIHHYERALEADAGAGEEQQVLRVRCLTRLLEIHRSRDDRTAGDAAATRLLAGYPQIEEAIIAAARYRADTGQVAEAERLLRAELTRSQHGAGACRALADVLARSQKADAVAALAECADAHPGEAEPHCRLAAQYWDWAYRDESLSPQRRIDLADSGLRAIDRALAQSPENADALVYKGLLCKVKAEQLPDGPERTRLLEQAEALRAQAIAIKRREPTGAAGREH